MATAYQHNNYQVNKEKTLTPVLGRVLAIYSTPASTNPQYQAFYNEIVTRCVADVAGILQTGDDALKTKPGAELHGMYDALKQKYGEDSARALILNNLSGFIKGQVYTPHPTEVFANAAIEAEEKVMEALLKFPSLFSSNKSADPITDPIYTHTEAQQNLHDALQALSEAIKHPPKQQLTIDEEMRRSIRFSQRQFDSVPEIANAILGATGTDSSSLDANKLKHFSHLIEPDTWSPGDQDSKPDMTAEMLANGIALNQRAMMFHYFRQLVALGSTASTNEHVKPDTLKEIQRIMYRLLKTGCEAYQPPKPVTVDLAKNKLLGVSESGALNVPVSSSYSAYANHKFFTDFTEKNFYTYGLDEPYSGYEEFLKDLQKLRNATGINQVREEKNKNITSIDALIIQTMNFKDSSLKVQIRQNAEVHQKVVQGLFDLVADKVPLTPDQKNSLTAHGEQDSSGIEALLKAFNTDAAFANTFKAALAEKLKEVKQKLVPIKAEIEKRAAASEFKDEKTKNAEFGKLVDDVEHGGPGRDNYNIYQTMESLGIAAQNPDRIPKYLIAECRSKTDILEAFFLLKVMESMRAPNAAHKVQIVNLVEHPDLAIEGKITPGKVIATEMTTGALQNDYFP